MLAIKGSGNSSKTNSEEVLVDALPYIDFEYEEPGMKEIVNKMVEEEKRRYRPTKNYLEHLPPLELNRFETPIMKKEFDRMNMRLPMDNLSMKRYELPPPPSGKLTDITAWSECLDNSYAQLEHQATRISNLELMLEYGPEGWKSYITVISRMIAEAKKRIETLQKEIQDLNWKRKSEQVSTGEQLKRLQNSWVGLVSKNYEIEQACLSKEFIRYEKSAELAQLKFILSDVESERSGARIRRRVRRFFLQKRGMEVDEENENDEEEEEEEEDSSKNIEDSTAVESNESNENEIISNEFENRAQNGNEFPIPINNLVEEFGEEEDNYDKRYNSNAQNEDDESESESEEEIGPQPQ